MMRASNLLLKYIILHALILVLLYNSIDYEINTSKRVSFFTYAHHKISCPDKIQI